MTDDEFEEHRRRGVTDYFANERRRPYPLTEAGMEWVQLAACRNADPALFFPPATAKSGRPWTPDVMGFCGSCPVGADCLRHALLAEEFGWWAGTSPVERVRLRSALGIPFDYVHADHRTEARGRRRHRSVENQKSPLHFHSGKASNPQRDGQRMTA